jgi:hypothetical protein
MYDKPRNAFKWIISMTWAEGSYLIACPAEDGQGQVQAHPGGGAPNAREESGDGIFSLL